MAENVRPLENQAAPQPTFNPQAFPQQKFEPAFERNPEQEEWIKNEQAKIDKVNAESAARIAKVAESGITFNNSPLENRQWIGKLEEGEVQPNGVTTSTIRRVPLGPEAFSAGREVVFPDGTRTILPLGITSAEQIIHPETGEPLIEPVTAADIKAAADSQVKDAGALGADVQTAGTASKTATTTAAKSSTKAGAKK